MVSRLCIMLFLLLFCCQFSFGQKSDGIILNALSLYKKRADFIGAKKDSFLLLDLMIKCNTITIGAEKYMVPDNFTPGREYMELKGVFCEIDSMLVFINLGDGTGNVMKPEELPLISLIYFNFKKSEISSVQFAYGEAVTASIFERRKEHSNFSLYYLKQTPDKVSMYDLRLLLGSFNQIKRSSELFTTCPISNEKVMGICLE